MKKKIIALAILSSLAHLSFADDGILSVSNETTSLSIYGILDSGYGNVNHSQSFNNALPNQIYPFAALKTTATNVQNTTGGFNGGLSDSRLGLRGSRLLFEQQYAIFDLESGFDLTNFKLNNAAASLAANSGSASSQAGTVSADSSLNGGIFDRAEWAGIKGNWGSLTFGLQNNPLKDILGSYDPVKSDSFSPLGESGTIGGGGGVSEESRIAHSLRYNSAIIPNLNMSAAYQKGDSISTNYGSTIALSLNYEDQTFGLGLAYSNSKDAVAGGTSGTASQIALALYDVDSYALTGKYKFGTKANISGGLEHFERKTATDSSIAVGSLWSQIVTGGFATSKFTTPGVTQPYDVYFIGADYNLNADWNLAMGYYQENIGDESDATGKSGNIRTYTGVAKYKLNKMVDLYGAFTNNQFGGTVYSTGYFTTITAYGFGARVRF